MKKSLLLAVFAVLLLSMGTADAAKPLLPPIPSPLVLSQVINQTVGVPFDPIGAPAGVIAQFNGFGAPFTNVGSTFDVNQAVQYFSTDNRLKEIVIPLLGNAYTLLVPDMIAPGSNPRPGKVIGGLYQPSRGAAVIVAVFPQGSLGCILSLCSQPEKLRFYFDAVNYVETAPDLARFKDPDLNLLVEQIDEGALIAHKYSCVTVGLQQVCWKPYDPAQVRQDLQAVAQASYNTFNNLYQFDSTFLFDETVPDLLGHSLRGQCRNALAGAVTFDNLPSCHPNMIFTPASEHELYQPIAIFILESPADIAAYNAANGSFVGQLPAGQYLVINATPTIKTVGSIGVLYLVNADMSNHYLIPSMVMQGVVLNPAADKPRAAIKDGFVWGRGFGY